MKRFTAREILLILSDVAIFFGLLNVLQTDEKHERNVSGLSGQNIKYRCLTS